MFIPREILEPRFWDKVTKTRECWNWIGSTRYRGYGEFWTGNHTVPAHRVAYEWFVAPIPKGFTVDHICRNTGCVNPDHLRVMTLSDNCRLGNRYAFRKACSKGHLYTPETTIISKAYGSRECRLCKREKDLKYHYKHRDRILARKREAWRKAAGKE